MILKNEIKNDEGRIIAREYLVGAIINETRYDVDFLATMLDINEDEVETQIEKRIEEGAKIKKNIIKIEYLKVI